jgi:hypothetical protein
MLDFGFYVNVHLGNLLPGYQAHETGLIFGMMAYRWKLKDHAAITKKLPYIFGKCVKSGRDIFFCSIYSLTTP